MQKWFYAKAEADSWVKSKQIIFTLQAWSEMWRCACKTQIGRLLTSTTPEPPENHICVFTIRGAAGRFIKTASEMEWAFSKQCHVFKSATVQRNLNGSHFEDTSIIDIYPF